VRLAGLPGVEVYHTTMVDASHALNHTEILLPIATTSKALQSRAVRG
jgi:hypothetical protein